MAINPFGGIQRTPAPAPQLGDRGRAFLALRQSGFNPFVHQALQQRLQPRAPSVPQVGTPAAQPPGNGGEVWAGGSPDWVRNNPGQGLAPGIAGGGSTPFGPAPAQGVGASAVMPPPGHVGAFQTPGGYGGLQTQMRERLTQRMKPHA